MTIDWDLTIKIILGIAALVMSGIALHYKRLEHRKKVDELVDGNAKLALFISRQSMLKHLLGMYDRATSTDEIWGQTVSGRDYSEEVRDVVLDAAGRGVSFKIIASSSASGSSDLPRLFAPLRSARITYGSNNSLRIQGLSDLECVVALPSTTSYTAVLIRDKEVVRIFRAWFDERFSMLSAHKGL